MYVVSSLRERLTWPGPLSLAICQWGLESMDNHSSELEMPRPQWSEPQDPAKEHPYSWPRSREIISDFYVMLPGFELSCYTVVCNSHNPYISSSKHLHCCNFLCIRMTIWLPPWLWTPWRQKLSLWHKGITVPSLATGNAKCSVNVSGAASLS